MKNLILIMFITSIYFPILAESFQIESRHIKFTTDKKKRITTNDICERNEKCQGLKVLHKLSINSLNSNDTLGGANPGPLLCEQVNGTVVMGKDAKGNQNSFCKFKDGSIIDNGTLTYYGIMNDRKRNNKK